MTMEARTLRLYRALIRMFPGEFRHEYGSDLADAASDVVREAIRTRGRTRLIPLLTRLYTPAYFVRSVKVSYAGRPVLAAEVDFSISENPYFRFYFVPSGEGELKAEAVDTKDLRFEAALPVSRSVSRAPAAAAQ